MLSVITGIKDVGYLPSIKYTILQRGIRNECFHRKNLTKYQYRDLRQINDVRIKRRLRIIVRYVNKRAF